MQSNLYFMKDEDLVVPYEIAKDWLERHKRQPVEQPRLYIEVPEIVEELPKKKEEKPTMIVIEL